MASVKIKSVKNSRTHDVLPIVWNQCDLYYAERVDNTHWKIYDNARVGYIVWPVEDVEVIVPDTDWQPSPDAMKRAESVKVSLDRKGITGPRRISSKGPNQQQIAKVKIASTGDSTDYYTIPKWATELRHLIQHKNMNFDVGNIFKAAYRLGEKEGVDHEYDLIKIIFFAQSELERVRREKNG